MRKQILIILALVTPSISFAAGEFDKKFNVNIDLLGGGYSSKGDAAWTFSNPLAFPTLSSDEKVPINNEKGKASGIQVGMGYRWHDWFSWNALFLVMKAEGENYTYTTSKSANHNIKVESSVIYLSPFIWTFYPLSFLYLQAGTGVIIEGNKVTTDIPNATSFDTGAGGIGGNLGAGVEFALNNHFTLRGGLNFIGGTLGEQDYKINEGTTNELTAKVGKRSVGMVLLNFGTKIYF